MGEVFLAFDIELERFVALKVLPSDVSNDKERIQRFVQEAKAASALNHPNILTIHEAGLVNGTRFIASEFIKGKTLRDKLKSEALNLSETIEIAIQITSALHTAHSSQIIHRDIKPENIMIREDNLVKVLDFGLAKLTVQKLQLFNSESLTYEQVKTISGMILGTAGYMSPEQARGKTVDHRTDIFSLGVVLYEILTGKQPFTGDTNSDVIVAILMKEPQNPRSLNSEIPAELERIILKTLCKDCEERYQNAKDLLEDFKELKQDLDFKLKIERKISANKGTEAKTEILKADTGKTINIETDPIDELPTYKNPFIKLTNRAKFVYKSRFSIPIILSLIVIGFFAYLISPAIWLIPPKNEAVKLFNNGTEALREGTYFKASKMFEDAIRIDNNFPNAHAGLAEAWIELDYFGRAQNEMLKVYELQRKRQTFLSSFSQTEDSLYIDAINATVLRNFSQAAGIYETLAQNHPNESHVYLDLGRAYEKNEEINKSIEYYEKAIQLDSQYGAAFLRLGILRSRKGEYEKALLAFDKAENIYDRLSNDEGVAEVKFHRGISLNSQDQLKSAFNQFEQVTSIPRANKYQKIKAMLQISSLLCSEGKTDLAQGYASDAIKLAKEERMENLTTNGLIDFGNAFFVREEYVKAEQHFRQALEFARKDDGRRNEARALLALGSLFVEQHKADEALQFIKQSLPFYQQGGYNKEVSQAYILQGFASVMKTDYSVAVQSFEIAAQLGETSQRALALTGLGTVSTDQEQYPKTLQYFEQSNKLYESIGNNYHTVFSQYNVADILSKLGLVEEAKQTLAKAEKIFTETNISQPNLQAKFLLLKAQIALSEGNFAEALKITKQITTLTDPEIASETYRISGLAQIFSKARNIDGVQTCVKAVEAALQTNDLRAVSRAKLSLAEAYLNVGNNKEALEKALEAKDYFVATGQNESGWRSWLIAAKSSKQKGDKEFSRQYSLSVLEVLSKLRSAWGEEYFKSYSNRADIKLYLEQVKESGQF